MQVNLSKHIYDKLSALSKELGMPRTQVINMLINQWEASKK